MRKFISALTNRCLKCIRVIFWKIHACYLVNDEFVTHHFQECISWGKDNLRCDWQDEVAYVGVADTWLLASLIKRSCCWSSLEGAAGRRGRTSPLVSRRSTGSAASVIWTESCQAVVQRTGYRGTLPQDPNADCSNPAETKVPILLPFTPFFPPSQQTLTN